MKINSLNTCSYSIYTNKKHQLNKPNQSFAQNVENTPIQPDNFKNKNWLVKIGAPAGGLLALCAAFKNKNFVQGFNKIFRPNKNTLLPINKIKNLNKLFTMEVQKQHFIRDFVEPMKKRAQGFVLPSGEKYTRYPSNGMIVWGPESRAKKDYFEWAVNEIEKAGAEIIDPKPGGIPKFDDLSEAWGKLFYDTENGITPQKVKEEFKKNEKFKALVVRKLDEIGYSVKNPSKNPEKFRKKYPYPDNLILNDSPDTNDAASRYGLIKLFTVEKPSNLCPATRRAGRVGLRILPMPYKDEPVEIWKKYIECAKETDNPDFIIPVFKEIKKIFKKRGKTDFNEIKPLLEYERPYVSISLDEPIEKWRDWIQYMANRKGISNDLKVSIFEDLFAGIGQKIKLSEKVKKETLESPKFLEIKKLVREKILELDKSENIGVRWDNIVHNALSGNLNNIN